MKPNRNSSFSGSPISANADVADRVRADAKALYLIVSWTKVFMRESVKNPFIGSP